MFDNGHEMTQSMERINIVERAAYHEAGHAVVLRRFNRQAFQYGHIIVTPSGEGLTQTLQPTHGAQTPPLTHHQKCLVAMAGRAAEQMRYPDLSHGDIPLSLGDEDQVRELIRQSSNGNLSESDITMRRTELLEEAKEILRDDWQAVRVLAERLLISPGKSVCLDGADALQLMDDALARNSC
jgi:hypothetical protein